jgi:DNA repair exonuclease SbcCD nuclease subunit
MSYYIDKNANHKAGRIFFITDTHLGVKNNSNEWIEMMREYFYAWFIPLVRREYKPGDILIHLGDVYDSRQSLNLKVLNLGIEIFEELSLIFRDGIYVIAGNHDLWSKNTNDINSLKSIKWIPGVNVIEEPMSIDLQLHGRRLLLMPWRKDHKTEEETLDFSEPHDLLCCHADIRGLKFNRYVDVQTGASVDKFSKFTRVYSGHIHYAQKSGNITMLGSPYEITRSDMGNKKSITILDLSNMEEIIFNNDFSPKFKKFYFKDILEMTPGELEPKFRNNFVDIMIDPNIALKAPLGLLTDMITSQRSLKFHPYDENQASGLSEHLMDTDGEKQFNVIDFIKEYVRRMECDDDTKERIIASLLKLHKIVTTQEQDQKI